MPAKSIHLDSLPPLESGIGYGELGTGGSLDETLYVTLRDALPGDDYA